jgi:hypothetical protein
MKGRSHPKRATKKAPKVRPEWCATTYRQLGVQALDSKRPKLVRCPDCGRRLRPRMTAVMREFYLSLPPHKR